MRINRKVILALVAGLALYQIFGLQIERCRALIDSMVLVELIFKVVRFEDHKVSEKLN